ncbi:dTDP-4-dehydrorhamnose reductase [Leuconostoc gasicomitatum]|uniref:dTDP-4-dehydrorhamnose reductase n=1 Tax=Leuconostoc gelidum group TaxID=3016637 RepID=UPI00027E6A39|nr:MULTISPECIES: dTDP-4-dehydrorhamnose reductase [Leuconostoc gelidum group]AFS40131.1 dTDP-4-dehydrorhamnose reductase [Leuconostoc gelidum JB7]MBZ5952062.1 dTDP-4-dehydrorhamnose reductase [Leuconostoc gasicomitatum]MBZ5968229.1 dTDP-4-dehydrorhamnose reductase [Leuconostoc gasicomitatum]QDJ30114.1 dTDP-4-dehydrorhamnose reductase [Leuconostoc gelidum subsp. gelidum]SOC02230.1 dTDP-4-dehydrorhamnose reductase [Leuconostoc gasicomitatum]
MKFLVTGANGQLGQELQKLLRERNLDFVAFDSKQLDITDREAVMSVFEQVDPDVVLHAAAYTKVDVAEDEGRDLNWQVNVNGTKNVADAAKQQQAKLIAVSTDYVFDGTKNNDYVETDAVNPQNAYGRAKLAGELAVTESGVEAYIVRTSWVFGEFGNNFVYTMQRLAATHPKLTVVNDQLGRPTWTRTLAEFMLHLINAKATYGIYHLSNEGTTTWFDFAREILKDTDVEVAPVTSAEFPQKAYRPRHSVMSLDKAESTGFEILNWREALNAFLMGLD